MHQELTTEAYLGTVIPVLLESTRHSHPPRSRTVVQIVLADREDCDWFYAITADSVKTSRGISDDVDLTLSFLSEDLCKLSCGALDVARAVRASRIKVMGDEEVLRWFSARLDFKT